MILKYTQAELKTLGDRGINRLVAKYLFNDCRTRHVRGGGDSISVDEQSGKIYDFVNCPNDIMPLAHRNKISLAWCVVTEAWEAWRDEGLTETVTIISNKNPLRSICEVFILMKQEGVNEI